MTSAKKNLAAILAAAAHFSCSTSPIPNVLNEPPPTEALRAAYALIDVKSGQVVHEQDSDVPLPPASVAKIFTSAYALEALGPNHRFVTRVLSSGDVLYLVGGGDPVLSFRELAAMAERVVESGRREFRAFRYDDSLYPGESQITPEIEASKPYNTAVNALSLEYNQAFVQGGTGNKFLNWVPDLPIVRQATDHLPPEAYPGSARLFRVSVRDGARYAAEAFAFAFRMAGGNIPDPVPGKAGRGTVEITRHASPPLVDLVAGLLEDSNNLTAELLSMAATRARSGVPSLAQSARQLSEWINAKLHSHDVRLTASSGLNPGDRISANSLARFLVLTDRNKPSTRLRGLLPSLAWQWRRSSVYEHPGFLTRTFAKSGTLDFTNNLAGYLFTRTGRKLAFAVLVSDPAQRSSTRTLSTDALAHATAEWQERALSLIYGQLSQWAAEGAEQTPVAAH